MSEPFEKLERDDKIAVIFSPGYGAGWYSWNSEEGLAFDREIAQAVLDGDRKKAIEIAQRKYPGGYYGAGGDLTIEWVPKGSRFIIDEHDGSEAVSVIGPEYGLVA